MTKVIISDEGIRIECDTQMELEDKNGNICSVTDGFIMLHNTKVCPSCGTLQEILPEDPMNEEMVTIPKSRLDDLEDDALMLACLQNAGVDNWQGYDYASREYHDYKDNPID